MILTSPQASGTPEPLAAAPASSNLDPHVTRPMGSPLTGRLPGAMTYQAAFGLLLAATLTGGCAYLLVMLPGGVDLLLITIALFGGCGGVLYAVREGDLVSPRFRRVDANGTAATRAGGTDPDVGPEPAPEYVIRLGWVGDVLYGVAGAATIFLLIPGLSENAVAAAQEMLAQNRLERNNGQEAQDAAKLAAEAQALKLMAIREENKKDGDQKAAREHRAEALAKTREAEQIRARNPYSAGSSDDAGGGKNGTDFLEVLAVALIGGFCGRAVLQRASAQVLQEKMERGLARVEKQHGRMTRQLKQARADSRALELTARQLNPLLPPLRPDVLARSVARATEAARLRVFDYTAKRLQDEREKVASAAIPILHALLQSGTTPQHPFLACLGTAHRYLGDRVRAAEFLDAAIELIKDDPAAVDQLKTYQVEREAIDDPKPSRGKAAAALPLKG